MQMRTSTLVLAIGCVLVATAVAQRFDMKVRNDFFAGFTGDKEALIRAMRNCEEALKEDAGNAQALVWHGAGLFFQSGQAFQTGDSQTGMDLYQRGLKEMETAVSMAPDDVGVRIPRGATLLTGTHQMPPQMARPLIEKGVGDYERTLDIQSDHWSTLGSHPRGELLFGLADGYSRLGDQAKAQTYFERIQKELPGTPYAKRAAIWLDTKSLPQSQTGCIGCHTGK
jgi:tetratricopeptide (TPR) repeat protein